MLDCSLLTVKWFHTISFPFVHTRFVSIKLRYITCEMIKTHSNMWSIFFSEATDSSFFVFISRFAYFKKDRNPPDLKIYPTPKLVI